MAETQGPVAVYLVLRTLFLSALILDICSVHGSGEADLGRCPQNLPYTSKLATFRQNCYQFVRLEKFWDDARDFCWAYGGSLVRIPDAATNRFIVNTLNGLDSRHKGVWIGLHDRRTELIWQWVTEQRSGSEPMTFNNWDSGHPGDWFHSVQDCVRMKRDSGWKWRETPCHSLKWHYRFICQYAMTPTTPVANPGFANGQHHQTTTTLPVDIGGHRWSLVDTDPDSESMLRDKTSSKPQSTQPVNRFTVKWEPKVHGQGKAEASQAESMASVSKDDGSPNGIIFIVIGICLSMVAVVIIVAFLIVRRSRRKEQQQAIPVVYPPKFDNPLYGGDCEAGVAQVLLSNSQQRSPPLDGPCMNVYVSPEDMEGTGTEVSPPTLTTFTVPDTQEGSCAQRESVYLAPLEERRGHRPLPECPMDDASDEEPEVTLRQPGVAGYIPVSTTENPNTAPVGYLPMDGASRRGSRDTLDELHGSMGNIIDQNMKNEEQVAGIGYDSPKPSHIYAEIPFDEKEGNIYEALDDLKH